MRRVWVWTLVLAVSACLAEMAHASEPVDSLRTALRSRRYVELIARARSLLSANVSVTRSDSLGAADVAELVAEACWRERLHRPADAESLAADAVKRRELLHGASSPEVGRVLPHLARVQRFTGNRAAALETFQRSVAILQAYPDRELELATTLVGLGNLQQELDNLPAARQSHEHAYTIRTRLLGPTHRDTGVALVNLGNTLRSQGEAAEALLADTHALEIFEGATPLDTLDVLTVLPNAINSMFTLRLGPAVLPYCERFLSLAVLSKVPGDRALRNAYEDMGLAAAQAGQTERARAAFNELVRLLPLDFEREPGGQLIAWHSLGLFEHALGRPDSALAIFERTRAAYEALSSGNPTARYGLMTLQLDIGQVAFKIGADSLARVRYAEAVRTGEARELPLDHPDMIGAHLGLGMTLFHQGEIRQAFDLIRAAALGQAVEQRREFESMTEEEAAQYLTSQVDIGGSLIAALLKDPTETTRAQTYDALIRSHSLMLDAMTFRRRLLASTADTTVRRLSQELAALVREDAHDRSRSQPKQPTSDRVQRRRELERELSERSGPLRRDLDRRDVGLSSVVAKLRPDQALVQFMRVDLPTSRTYRRGRDLRTPRDSSMAIWVAWVERASREAPDLVTLGPAREIDERILRWAQVLTDDADATPRIGPRERQSRGDSLRRAIWDPLTPYLTGARHVLLVPDAALYRTPIVTLPTASGQPILELGPEIQLLGSPRDMLALGGPSDPRGAWLALADPDFDAEGSQAGPGTRLRASRGCVTDSLMSFVRLPGTLDEARGLTSVASQQGIRVRILSGKAATVDALENLSPEVRGLHIATHGFALADTCSGGALRVDPMLRFGIVLAGVNRAKSGEGFVTAAELATLDLSHVKHVVVSACQSGAGTYLPGEGLYGVGRAITLAGASSSVLSIGPIEDEIAALWMKHFYTHLLVDHESGAASARGAAREVRKRVLIATGRDRPSQWGAFLSIGD